MSCDIRGPSAGAAPDIITTTIHEEGLTTVSVVSATGATGATVVLVASVVVGRPADVRVVCLCIPLMTRHDMR